MSSGQEHHTVSNHSTGLNPDLVGANPVRRDQFTAGTKYDIISNFEELRVGTMDT